MWGPAVAAGSRVSSKVAPRGLLATPLQNLGSLARRRRHGLVYLRVGLQPNRGHLPDQFRIDGEQMVHVDHVGGKAAHNLPIQLESAGGNPIGRSGWTRSLCHRCYSKNAIAPYTCVAAPSTCAVEVEAIRIERALVHGGPVANFWR